MKILLAIFAVLSFAQVAQGQWHNIKCESWDHQYANCAYNVAEVRLGHVESTAQCHWGHSYGIHGDGTLWVNHGCRAYFTVRYRGGHGGGGHHGGGDIIYGGGYDNCLGYYVNQVYYSQGEVFKHSYPGTDKFWAHQGAPGRISGVINHHYHGCVLTVNFYKRDVSYITDEPYNPSAITSGLIRK